MKTMGELKSNRPVESFNILDYDSTANNGTTDAAAVFATVLTDVLASTNTHGKIVMPAGNYSWASAVDFNVLRQTYKVLTIEGVGSGGPDGNGSGATKIINSYAGPVFSFYGTVSGNAEIVGVTIRDLSINNTVNIGSGVFCIDADYLTHMLRLERLFIRGNGTNAAVGSGIRILNSAYGQHIIDQVHVFNFNGTGSIGFKMGGDVTARAPSGVNGGNSTFRSCLSFQNKTGYHIGNSTGTLHNNIILDNCKAVAGSGGVTSSGFKLELVQACILKAPHSEGYISGGILVDGAKGCVILAPFVGNGTAAGGAGSVGIKFINAAVSNEVLGGNILDMETGVSYDSTSVGNRVEARDDPTFPVTTMFSDAATVGKNISFATRTGFPYLDTWTVVPKTADESVASSATDQQDDHILFATVSGAVYDVELAIIYGSPAGGGTPDLKFEFGEDATVRGHLTGIGYSTADAATVFNLACATGTTISVGTATGDRMIIMRGQYVGGGGTVRLLWAQATSGSNATIVRSGTLLKIRRLK
jgi:hypothetical protein